MQKLSMALLLAFLAVAMAQPDAATRGVPASAHNATTAPSGVYGLRPVGPPATKKSDVTNACLFDQKDVSAQDITSIKKACGECCLNGLR